MAPMSSSQRHTAADFDVIQNRVAVALAKRERLIKSWTASSSRPRPAPKTQEELDAEDAELFRIEPLHLGLGAPVHKEYLDGDAKRTEISSNARLRHLMLGRKAGQQASKPRDTQEKAASLKRGLKEESSDEDEGRSTLGKPKKFKNVINSITQVKPSKEEVKMDIQQDIMSASKQAGKSGSSHVTSPEVKSQISQTLSVELSQKNPSLQASKKQEAIPKKPLVDYLSDDDEEADEKDGSKDSTGAISQQRHEISIASSGGASSILKTSISMSHHAGAHHKSDAAMNSNVQTIGPPASDKKATKSEYDIPDDSMNPPAKPLSKTSSSHSSKISSRASSSDSEPSDMETAIPLALTSDVIAPISLSTTESNSAADLKRARKREKRAREKERQQQKASAVAVIGGQVGVKKLKDRLLDANGN